MAKQQFRIAQQKQQKQQSLLKLQRLLKGLPVHQNLRLLNFLRLLNEQKNQAGEVVIPANSDLVFDVELVDFKSAAELEQQRRIMQQLQQMQGHGGKGAPAMPGMEPAPGQ